MRKKLEYPPGPVVPSAIGSQVVTLILLVICLLLLPLCVASKGKNLSIK